MKCKKCGGVVYGTIPLCNQCKTNSLSPWSIKGYIKRKSK